MMEVINPETGEILSVASSELTTTKTGFEGENLPALIERAKTALSEATSFAEVKEIRDRAEAMRVYARSIQAGGEAQNRIAEIKVRAERRMGQELARTELSKGAAQTRSHDVTAFTLPDIGVTKMESSRWQSIAAVPDAQFEDYIATAREITSAGLQKIGRGLKRREEIQQTQVKETCSVQDLLSLAREGRKFGCIYADPPWRYDNRGTRAAVENVQCGTANYSGTMSIEEIADLPVGELAAENSHLHLWVTNAHLFESREIIKAWGFEFKSSFIWCKPTIGTGNYWRNSHEMLLTCVKGNVLRFADQSIRSWEELDRGRHSEKPEYVRKAIERTSPGPFLELFGRQQHEGWAVWGNQVERDALYGVAA